MGISSAATIRVGNSLGAGQPITSQKMSVVAVGYAGLKVVMMFSLVHCCLCSSYFICYWSSPVLDKEFYWKAIYQ